MPGILPLKTIQLSTSSQSRIAQACDRCRSKKIRCDGIQPNCTPCQAVNFECKTSDKLSRKAYPKGYTSSLEERVRELEAEVRQLKDLLDEKDEKIDILAKMRRPSAPPAGSPTPPASTPSDHGQAKEDCIKRQQAPRLYGKHHAQYFMGASSSRAFVEAFKAKLLHQGRLSIPFEGAALFLTPPLATDKGPQPWASPPRVVSDQLINIFFQEWAPLFPVLHRPTFLRMYEEFVSSPLLKDPRQHAQMYLVFGIAALSSLSNLDLLPMYEVQWRKALDATIYDTSIETLQCVLLAQIYCIVKGDSKRLLHYTGVATSMANRLGLHQSQAAFKLGALTRETRKKVFWALYTLDCFAAASLGLPRLFKDADIETEEPADVDDENVSESGFQATLPGEHTKLSSAIALFRASKLLARVIDELYSPAGAHDLSLSRVANLTDELDAWRDALPGHLRLEFIQDKLNVNVTSNRSPLLALVYFHIRCCIHRPVVAADVGDRAVPSVMALADGSKRIYQILRLLEQRQMSFTMPINRTEMLSLAGIGLLYQALELRGESKMIRENQKLVASIADLLRRTSKPASTTLMKMSCILFGQEPLSSPRRNSPEGSMSPPKVPESKSSPRDQLQAIAARFSFSNSRNQKKSSNPGNGTNRRSTAPNPPTPHALAIYSRSGSQASQCSAKSALSEPMRGLGYEAQGIAAANLPNLDFFSIGSQPPTPDLVHTLKPAHTGVVPNDWDQLVSPYPPAGAFDSSTPTGQFSAGADFLGTDHFTSQISPPPLSNLDWSPHSWNMLDASISSTEPPSATAHSVFSLSDESLTSAEDLSSCDLGSDYPGFAIPTTGGEEFHEYPEFGLGGELLGTGLTA